MGMTRLGVLVSGNGTNLQALIDAIKRKELQAEIVLVISNKPDALALERAAKSGISSLVLKLRDFSNRDIYDKALAKELLAKKVDLVILAGFMHILPRDFLERFPNRILNVHPALLPDDPDSNDVLLPDGTVCHVLRGKDAVKQALAARVSWSGCSVHLVTEQVDAGPVILRQAVPVYSDDTSATLHARIQKEEHRLLPEAVAQYAATLSECQDIRFRGG